MRLSEKINGSLSSKYDNSIISSLNESTKLKEARSHKEDNEKVAPRDAKNKEDRIETYKSSIRKNHLAKRDIVGDANQTSEKNPYGKNFEVVRYEKLPNKYSNLLKVKKDVDNGPYRDEYKSSIKKYIDKEIKDYKDAHKKEEVNEDYKLDTRFDPRASFYGKAEVKELPNGDKELYSYGTLVAAIRDGKPYTYGRFSQTTSRHQKEFFKQEGFEPSDAELTEGCKLNEEDANDILDASEKIAKEIETKGVMNFQDIDNMAMDLLKLDADDFYDREVNTDIYVTLNYLGIGNNFGNGDFFTDDYAKEHPEVLEESSAINLIEARSHKKDNEKVAPRGEIEYSYGEIDKLPKRAIFNKRKEHDLGRFDRDEIDEYRNGTSDIAEYKRLKKYADEEKDDAKYHSNQAKQYDDMASDIVRDKKLDRAKKQIGDKEVFARNESVKSLTLRPATVKLSEAESLELKVEYSIDDLDDLVWSGARDRWSDYTDDQKQYLVDYFYDTAGYIDGTIPTTTEFNDFIWFEADDLLEQEGLTNDSDDEEEDIDESVKITESGEEDLDEAFYEKVCRAYIDTMNLEWVTTNPENNNSVVHGYFKDDIDANKYKNKITPENFKDIIYSGGTANTIEDTDFYEYDTWEDFYKEYVKDNIAYDIRDIGLDNFYISKEDLEKLGFDLVEESCGKKAIKEDEHSDNFVISMITKDRVYWKRKSDGEELVTTIDVFKDGMDPSEWRSELELQDYKID